MGTLICLLKIRDFTQNLKWKNDGGATRMYNDLLNFFSSSQSQMKRRASHLTCLTCIGNQCHMGREFFCVSCISKQPSITVGFSSENRTYKYQDPTTYELFIFDPTNAFLCNPLPYCSNLPCKVV